MRPKTKNRVVLLSSATVGLVVLVGGFYEFRQHQITVRTIAYRQEGLDAFHHGDFAKALDPLSRYNTRVQNDAETLFAFGKARSRVEAPNNRNLGEAIQYFRRGLEIQPDNLDAKHQLLELYASTGYSAEANTLADELIRHDAKDVIAWRSKAKALSQVRRFDEALQASQKLNELAPLDIDGQSLTLRLMGALGRAPGDILAVAKKNVDAHPKDARFVLLDGLARHCVLDDTSARERYLAAAAMPAPDADFIKTCSDFMDEIGMFDKSQELLERAAADGHDPRMLRMLVQRLWQNGRYPQVIDRLKDLDPAKTTSDSQLLAYRAFSLYNLQRNAEAKPIVAALATRKDDDVALAWAIALDARFESPNLSPRDVIAQYQAALVRDPGNAVVRYLMGESYAQLGETELALQSWRQVVREVPSWPMPRTQIAYILAATGRSQTAVEEAVAGFQRGQNLGSAIGLIVALASHSDRGVENPADRTLSLELAKQVQEKVPGEPQTLPIYVSLLSRTGHRDQAISVIQTALAKSYPIGTDAWLKLASVSRSQKLSLERPILDHCEKAYGFSPQLAMANAILMSDAGNIKGGLDYLAAAASTAKTDQATWKLAIAQFREQVKDPKSHDAWVEVADGFPNDLSVQDAVLDLPDGTLAWQDRPFIERTINRVRSLTGDQGYRWQLARCRWLLTSPDKKRDSAEAVVTLSDIVRGSPGLVIPRLYLAQAMQNVDNSEAAVEQLRAAADIDHDNPAIMLDLVHLLQGDGKFADAKTYLDRAAKSASDSITRQRVAYAYAQQGELDIAIALLKPDPSQGRTNEPTADALLAELLRRKGDFDSAGKLYTDLIANPSVDPLILASAADFFAAHNQMDKAHGIMDRLSSAKLPAGHREVMLASFEERHGSKDKAVGLFHQAIEANPTDVDLWRQLISYQLRQNAFDPAIASADEGLKKIPNSDDLKTLRSQAVSLRAGNGQVDAKALITELSKDPHNVAAVESQQTLNEIHKNNDAPDKAVMKLRRVADRYPRFQPVQTQVVRMYMEMGKIDEAINVAARSAETFPNDPEPIRLLTVVYATDKRWPDVLNAAKAWRTRSLEHPMDADLAIARAQLELSQPREAMQQLTPYLEQAKQDPDHNGPILTTWAQALFDQDRTEDAGKLLSPLLSRSDDWRAAWLRFGPQFHNPADAQKWIAQGAATVPAASLNANYEVANAWYVAGIKLQQPDFFHKAQDAIKPLTTRSDATPGVMMMAGGIAEKLGDPDTAISSYRKALQLDPNLPMVENNLAYLLLTKGSDLGEATQLAEKACASNPGEANYYDTLARVYAKAGNLDRAITTFQKVLDLDPRNVQAMVPTIRLLHEKGQQDAARSMMARLETLLQNNPALINEAGPDLQTLKDTLNQRT